MGYVTKLFYSIDYIASNSRIVN